MRIRAASILIIAKYPVHFVKYLDILAMKIKNIIPQTTLSEATGGGQAAAMQRDAQLRAANAAAGTNLPRNMRDATGNGPKGRTGFAANDNIVRQAGNMAGMSGATAEEIVSSPWYARWYDTFASGVKSTGRGIAIAGKFVSKLALPLIACAAIYEGYVEISAIASNDPNRKTKIVAIVTKLVADYGFPMVAGYLGAMAGGAIGVWAGGIGAIPGAVIGAITAEAAALATQYAYGDNIDAAIDDFVDNVLMDVPTQTTTDKPLSRSDFGIGASGTSAHYKEVEAQKAADAAASDFVSAAPRQATGTYTAPYEPETTPSGAPTPLPEPAVALSPAQALAANPVKATAPNTAAAASPTGKSPPPAQPKLPVVPPIPKTNIPNKPKPATPPATTTAQPNYDELTFKQAFARARERATQLSPNDAGKYTFTWRGKPYQTNYKGSGTAAKPNEPYIPQNKQRGMMSTAPINNPYENPRRSGKAAVGEGLLDTLGKGVAGLFKGGKALTKAERAAAAAAEAAAKAAKALEKTLSNGRTYRYDELKKVWYDIEKEATVGKAAARVPAASVEGRELYAIRSAKIDAAGAGAATAAGRPVIPKITPEAAALLRKTSPDLWTAEQLASRGYDASHVPMLKAARNAGIDIVAVADDEIVKAPWYKFWYKGVKADKLPPRLLSKGNMLSVAMYSAFPVFDAIGKSLDLDKNDPNYARRLTEIWTACIAQIGVEATAAILGGIIGAKLMKSITSSNRLQSAAGFIANIAAIMAASTYISPHIQSIVNAISDAIVGEIPRGPVGGTTADGTISGTDDVIGGAEAGTLEASPLYKKAYDWAVKAGFTGKGPARFARRVANQGPNGPLAKQLDSFYESAVVAWLHSQLQESTNARRTVNIHNTIKSILSENANADKIERFAFTLLEFNMLNELDPNSDNFMTNVTAAIAANTKGDKVGAQKALDAAKLNNPATGTDQANQKKVLDQLAKTNPGLNIPNTNPNSTQSQPLTEIGAPPMPGTITHDPGTDLLAAYNEFAAKYPAAKFLLDIVPVTGAATSIIDASQDLYNGKYGQAAIDILGAIPAFKIGKYLSKGLQNTVKAVNKGAKVANVGNATANLVGNTIGSASANTVPQTNAAGDVVNESPKMGDHVMLELADGRVIVAPISELRGNSMIVALDETGHQWLDESPDHSALKIGQNDGALSNTGEFWNGLIDRLTHDTPAGWAQLFINLQNTTGHAARTMPQQWAKIWRQQHIALGDDITRGDMLLWINEVQDAIDHSGIVESSLNPAGGKKLVAMLNSKDPAMLAVWMSSRAGNKGISVAKFAKDKAVKSGLPANHWWSKIKHLVNEAADPYSMEKRYYIVRKTSSAAPVDGISGFHRKSEADKKLATMKNPDQYMVRAIDSTKLPKDEMTESRRSDINFTPEDIAVIAGMTDIEDAKKHAIRLITRNSRRPMSADKIKWFMHHINNSKSIKALTKMMYDLLLSGEGLKVIGSVGSMSDNSYRRTFKEDDDEDDDFDEEEELYYDAINHMGNLYHALTDKKWASAAAYLSELGMLYQEAGVYLPNAIDMITDRQVKMHIERINGLLDNNKYDVIRGILTMIKTGHESVTSISNLISVLEEFNADWPELAAIEAAVAKALPNRLSEAEYKGKTVPLSKPIRTSPSEGGKFKVYVKDPKTGNIKMVRFGDTTGLSIKRDDPKRRKNYRARHHCDNPGPKTKANYWSCKMWTAKPVGKILKGK